ncbi:hypothetical protein CPC08DRAFT_318249 [Agrocybe pediades]|nr:hypothetical protein CPC08DRAFT_318249 [Agrocybe pediades]
MREDLGRLVDDKRRTLLSLLSPSPYSTTTPRIVSLGCLRQDKDINRKYWSENVYSGSCTPQEHAMKLLYNVGDASTSGI